MPVDTSVVAQLAASAYRNATERNRIAPPVGWTEIATYPANGASDGWITGFSASAYRGPGGEIVIAYAGSDNVNDWALANGPAATGFYSPQVVQAAQFYWQVLNRPDVGVANKNKVTFTGHSLGGGLASLMAVYFDRPATTFDSAPFETSAFGPLLSQYAATFALLGISDSSWEQYRAAQAAGTLAQLFRQREAAVSHTFVTNEALEALRYQYTVIAGQETPLDSGSAKDHVSRIALHSVLLAWAMVSNSDFAAEIRKLPRLFALIDDGQLFGRERTEREQDFLGLLLKFEQSTGMLTQFTGDVKDISGKFSAAGPAVGDALVALTIAHYYRMSNGFDAQVGEAVRSVVGGLELALDGSGWNGRGFARAYELLRDMVDLLSGGSADLARAWMKDRLVISDGSALSFSDTAGTRDLVLGSTAGDSIVLGAGDDYASGLGGIDNLAGGADDDVLDGGSEADTLDGGPGNDTLLGGAGRDVYVFSGDWGHDTIEDSDGEGQVKVNGDPLPEGLKVGLRDNVWVSADGAFTYFFTPAAAGGSSGTLYVLHGGSANTIKINNYVRGQLGITLSDTPAPFAAPDTQLVAPAGTTPYELTGDPGGTASRDELVGSGGVDLLHGLLGDDRLDGGDNGDILVGGLGADRITGGAGNDAIHGGGHVPGVMRANEEPPADRSFVWLNDGPGWYAGLTTEGMLSVGGALWGYTAATGGANDADAGDQIDAGSGDDWVFGDAGADVIDLGAGDDIANGGQGADVIIGGDGADLIMGDYIVTGSYVFLASEHGADVLVGDAGADVIEGDGGDDHIYGGADDDVLWGDDTYGLPASYHGNDLLDGGSGNDRLTGQGGDDELYGGTGDDLLVGDDSAARLAGGFHGDDYLDGGDGDDELQGQGGADVLFGGSGADRLFGDDLTSRLAGEHHGADYLDGGDGDDYLEGHGGADELFGGDGADTLYGDGTAARVAPAFHGDDYLDGGGGADVLIGGGGRDTLFGGGGNDRLLGDDTAFNLPAAWHGNDYLDGEAGDDLLAGQGGADTLFGGEGNDTLMGDGIAREVPVSVHGGDYLDGGDGIDTLIGGGGSDVLLGGSGNDTLLGDDTASNVAGSAHGDDFLDGGAGNDVLRGGGGNDVLRGGDGADYLHGDDSAADLGAAYHGNDVLDGGAGADILYGGAGDDHLTGGSGNDFLCGGDADPSVPSGNDTYYFDAGSGFDQIADPDASAANSDVLALGPGISSAAVAMKRVGNDLLIVVPFSMDRIAVRDYFATSGTATVPGAGLIETVKFADGTSWSYADVEAFLARGGNTAGTYGTDTLAVLDDFANNANFFAYDDMSTELDDTIDARGGNDAIRGRGGNDWLIGGAGNDVLDGGPGNDALEGGAGDDLLNAAEGDDLFIFRPGDGQDAINLYKPEGQPDVDTLRFGHGIAPSDLYMYRYAGSLVIRIGEGTDRVWVQDNYRGPSGLDRIEFADGTSWAGADIERRVLRVTPYDDIVEGTSQADTFDGGLGDDQLYGQDGDDVLSGGAGNDALYGEAGNDMLDGGEGADTMEGGSGNDVYVVDSLQDWVYEGPSAGIDEVRSSISYALPANVEKLTLLGSAAVNATGNGLANTLTGNGAANVLDGGPGGDTMRGGGGDDLYVVDSTADVVAENANEGFDTVRASVSYTLGSNVEQLELTGSSATSGTGNSLDNVLIGNGANNTLSGGAGNDYLDGGGGSDTMRGGTGDDIYVVNAGTDVVTENANEGTDTVHSSVTLTLAANVEHLLLTGASAINGTGNSLANHIRGNGAANALNGSGGNDILQGAGGNDTLTDTSGNNLLDGGDGADSLNGGTAREFIAGGAGNDTLKLGGGADIIAFNRGHGADSVTAPASGAGLGESNDTLTLGGVRYAELRLARSGSDLLVKVAGTADSIKFTGWYSASGNRTVTTLQLIVDSTSDYNPAAADPLVNRRVVRLNFTSLVNAFNSAYAANPGVGDWAVPAASLSAAFVAGSDTQAIGGALAYQYGRAGGFGALDFATAVAVLGDPNFATAVQTFGASPTTGGFRLLGAGDIDAGTRAAAAGYLTAESWLLAAEAAFDDAPPDRLESAAKGAPAVAAGPLDDDAAAGSAEFESAMSTANRWRIVDAAMLGLAPGAVAVPGGEAAAGVQRIDDWLGWQAAAMAGGSSAGRARGQVAAC